jgi:hypothetical protein
MGAVWFLTEVYEFLSRLVSQGQLYQAGVAVNIQLHNTERRTLWIEDPMRAPFMYDRTTSAPSITFTDNPAAAKLADPKRTAAEAIRYFFDRFGWKPTTEQLMGDINKLYQLR